MGTPQRVQEGRKHLVWRCYRSLPTDPSPADCGTESSRSHGGGTLDYPLRSEYLESTHKQSSDVILDFSHNIESGSVIQNKIIASMVLLVKQPQWCFSSTHMFAKLKPCCGSWIVDWTFPHLSDAVRQTVGNAVRTVKLPAVCWCHRWAGWWNRVCGAWTQECCLDPAAAGGLSPPTYHSNHTTKQTITTSNLKSTIYII